MRSKHPLNYESAATLLVALVSVHCLYVSAMMLWDLYVLNIILCDRRSLVINSVLTFSRLSCVVFVWAVIF